MVWEYDVGVFEVLHSLYMHHSTHMQVVWGMYYWKQKRQEQAPGGRYTAVQMTDNDNEKDNVTSHDTRIAP